MKCMRIGCEHDATARPLISFASVRLPDGPRATADFNLAVCDEHKSTDPADYLTDEGWQRIVEGVRRAGKSYPSRATVRVSFTPIA